MFKKSLCIALMIPMMLPLSAIAFDAGDMLEAANSLAQREIIKDKSEKPSEYNLEDNVLRQEIGLIAGRLAKLEKNTVCSGLFKDITATKPNDWACTHIEPLVENNLISKNDYFRPEDKITKAESLKMLIKAIGYDFEYDPSSSVSWQKQYVDFAVEKEIVEEFTDYNVNASRGWVFAVADHVIVVKEREEKEEEMKEPETKKTMSDEVMKEIDALVDFL
jgi:hypothetical protein